jgi:hypothetical protein
MDPGPFIALAFASPAIIAAVGGIWLGSRALRIWGAKRGKTLEAIDELGQEIAEIHERLDFHERILQQRRDAARLEGESERDIRE